MDLTDAKKNAKKACEGDAGAMEIVIIVRPAHRATEPVKEYAKKLADTDEADADYTAPDKDLHPFEDD